MSQTPRLMAAALAVLLLPAQMAAPLAQGVPGGPKGSPYVPPAEVKGEGTPAFAGPNDPAAPLPAADELRLAAEDPPALVGRVARGEGNATMRLPGAADWQPATLNTALTEGTAIWTEPGGRLALDVGQSRLFLEGGSAIQLDELVEDGLRATLAEGSVYLRAQGLGEYEGLMEIATPEAQLATAVDGRYLVEAAGEGRPGRIAVFEGVADVTPAGGEPVRIAAGEALVFAQGSAPQRVAAGASVPLMAWALAAEPRRPIPVAAQGMTGIVDLAAYGRWDRSPDYGDVWYPPVQADWQPYRDGRWEWREPWGWTWVDAAPWGFAPAHYGRWVQVGPRWAWAPQPVRVAGPRVRPVWAPALVAFFGAGGGYRAGRPVGWVPLAPREPYYPWYRASPRYVQRVNVRQVVNVVNVRNVWVQRGGDRRWDDDDRRRDPNWARFHDRRLDEFRNRRAAIQVEERVMRDSRPVRAESRPVRLEDVRRAELIGGLPIRPGVETRGLTERGAERFGVPREALRRQDAERGAPPPRVREALAAQRRDDAQERRDDLRDRREDARDRREDAREDAARAAQRAERERELRERQADQEQRGQPDRPDRADRPDRPDADRAGRQDDAARRQRIEALRQQQQEQLRERQGQARQVDPRAAQQNRERLQGDARTQQDEARRQRIEEMRQRQQPGEAGAQGEARRQQIEQMRRQQQEQARERPEPRQRDQQPQQRGEMDDARRQQQEQARQQQEQMRQQQRAQQQEQARQQQRAQQQEQARQQQRAQQQEQARQQQEQARQQQRAQQQEQARQQQRAQQQEQMRQQQRAQQQEQARQQQEQMRQQQRAQQQEQARQQQRAQQEQMRQQQRAQQQEQMRQQQRAQQEQARQQQRAQQEQARQQQAEQRRQERQQRQ